MRLLIISACLLISASVDCQNIRATYNVSQIVKIPLSLTTGKEVVVNYIGYLFKKGNKYIYFEKPQYLQQYPNGRMSVAISDTKTGSYYLNTDSMQSVSYCSYDSLILRFREDNMFAKSDSGRNIFQQFDAKYYTWKLSNETKKINGWLCQKATLEMFGTVDYEVWFTNEIKTDFNVAGIVGIHGLIVEASRIGDTRKYILTSYSDQGSISDKVFWPAPFEYAFKIYPPLKVMAKPAEKSKMQKQAEILNSNQ